MISQPVAVGERFERERVLGDAGVAREIFHGPHPHHEMIVGQCVSPAIERAAGQHALLAYIDGLDLGVVQMRRRNQVADRGVDLLRLHFAGQHLGDQTMDGGIVVAADNC